MSVMKPPALSFPVYAGASLPRRLVAEGLGTALLQAVVVGSAIMGDRLAGGNAALTLARAATDTCAGIRLADVPGYVLAQLAGGAAATVVFGWLYPRAPVVANTPVTVRDLAPAD